MTNPSKAKGTEGETRVLGYLKANGFPDAHRKVLTGAKDTGDIQVTRNIVCEVKNHANWTARELYDWIHETTMEARHSKSPVGILVVLAPRKQVQAALVVEIEAFGPCWIGPLELWKERHATQER